MPKDHTAGFWNFCGRCLRAAWKELISKPQVWAQIAAGPVNAGILIGVIVVVSRTTWNQATQQLQILEVLGILAALTNAVVVIALSRVNVHAKGPGNTSFEVGAGDDHPPAAQVTTTTRTTVAPAAPGETA